MKTRIKETASDYLMAGHTCSQAVVMAWAEHFGLPKETAARLATGFAGGLACGETCGAVAGAAIVMGLAMSESHPKGSYAKDRCALAVQEFCERFRSRHRALRCHDLLKRYGVDPGDAAQMKTLRESGLCLKIVEDADRITAQILEEEM